jgi:hypothetical protein
VGGGGGFCVCRQGWVKLLPSNKRNSNKETSRTSESISFRIWRYCLNSPRQTPLCCVHGMHTALESWSEGIVPWSVESNLQCIRHPASCITTICCLTDQSTLLLGPFLYTIYEDVSKSSRTGRLERELQMLQLSATSCSYIGISVSQSSDFCRHNPLCCFSTSVYCCKHIFLYRLSPETFGYTLVHVLSRIWLWIT